jgi:hypothetical protein
MIEFVGSLPTWAGGLLSMLLMTASGLLVYLVSCRLFSKYSSDDLKEPVGHLFRVVGVLVSLMLSLAFAEVILDMRTVEQAIERETVAISDIFTVLGLFDTPSARRVQETLVEYTRSVSSDDWSALENDKLGERTSALKRQLAKGLLELELEAQVEDRSWSSLVADFDTVSDNRLIRLDGALSDPPIYTQVVITGFLIAMACFGAYGSRPPLIALVALYSLFVGLVLYLIISMSDPFQGGMVIESQTFRSLAATLESQL